MSGIRGDDDEQPAKSSAASLLAPLGLCCEQKGVKLTEEDDSHHDQNHQYMMIPEKWYESYCPVSRCIPTTRAGRWADVL